jgi:hypothetical protein
MSEEYVVCAVWPFAQRKAKGNRYLPWFGKCDRCGIKLALTDEIKQQKQDDPDLRTLCPQCADSLVAVRESMRQS